ncbi:hypothetical protein [Streptomyces sp. GbtcB7]|uniref:sulfurtransferase TusA family protein n=1 Tax=Streptomyces sp. GbtcB7 TaxID=2824752 RepID=UPI001C30E5E2|nr:hypothetical protein [Streptomyces sp. GbtcB7]
MHDDTAATADVVVDAGGESWPRVEALLERYALDLAGGVLEIHTGHPDVPDALTRWCGEHGHAVLTAQVHEGVTGLRIRICDPRWSADVVSGQERDR